MDDTQQDGVYTGATIEEDAREEAARLGRALLFEGVDSILAAMAAAVCAGVYFHPLAELVDTFGKVLFGFRQASAALPFLAAVLAVISISRLYVAARFWFDRRVLLS